MLRAIPYSLFVIFFSICFFTVAYLFYMSVAGRFFYKKRTKQSLNNSSNKTIAILVPAYREDAVIVSTVQNLLSVGYPTECFDVYVIADSFKKNTLATLRELPIQLIEVAFEKSTKTKSLNRAFSIIKKEYDIALICDADNMLANDFLQKINLAFNTGAKAVQGRRVAKNLDSPFAILDGCSEAINNHIFRKGFNATGLSSAVIGSGMAFEYAELKHTLSGINAVGGFDKVLQLKVARSGIDIQYLDDALIFDEKVSTSRAFREQRTRWLSTHFMYFRKFFCPAFKELVRGNFSYFNLAVLCNLVLPRAFLFILLPLLTIISFFIAPAWGDTAACLFVLFLAAIAIALPKKMINRDLWKALLTLPWAIFLMTKAVFQIPKANNSFIHTMHSKKEVTSHLFGNTTRDAVQSGGA
jgi:cellulose synthase/poly-beta-1,6-N-acetylglucosamine synthase-like glycosyltransferase